MEAVLLRVVSYLCVHDFVDFFRSVTGFLECVYQLPEIEAHAVGRVMCVCVYFFLGGVTDF